MPRNIRFHLDESRGSRGLAKALRLQRIDLSTTSDAGLSGATDIEQLQFALLQGRVLFTQDEDFTVLHAQGIEHRGILYCHQTKYSLGMLIQLLVLVWEAYAADELKNRLEYL